MDNNEDHSNTTMFTANENYLQHWTVLNGQNTYLLGRSITSEIKARKLKLGVLNPSVSFVPKYLPSNSQLLLILSHNNLDNQN